MKKVKKLHVEGLGRDKISDLPADLITKVLSFLPIRDAVRTCTLSSKWRNHWKTLRELVFDQNSGISYTDLVGAVKSILSSHDGPIIKFIISIPGLECSPQFGKAVLQRVEYFALDCMPMQYELPYTWLFSCHRLIHLDLSFCNVFKPPLASSGFRKLVTLKLSRTALLANFVETFIPSCPLLKELRIVDCTGVNHFNIEAPRLEVLELGCCDDGGSICLKKAPLIASVKIYTADGVPEDYSAEDVYSFDIEGFGSLPALEELSIDHKFLRSFFVGQLPPYRLSTTLDHLTVLSIVYIWFGAIGEVLRLFCLIRSTPNLRKLTVELLGLMNWQWDRDTVQDMLKAEDHADFSLGQLHEVGFYGVSIEPEMDFIEFVLAKAPVLQTLYVRPGIFVPERERHEILKKLNGFRRSSLQVRVIYLDEKCWAVE